VSILCPDGVWEAPETEEASFGLFSHEVGENFHSPRRPGGQSEGVGRMDHAAPPGWGEWRGAPFARLGGLGLSPHSRDAL
jgi:hypothetical protein